MTDTTSPTMIRDNPLVVDMGATGTITSNLLAATDPDNSNTQLTYTVVEGPSSGVLLKNGSLTSSFTQADIDNGLITYHETAGNVLSDFFQFFVSDPAGNKTNGETFPIYIPSQPTGPNPFPPAATSADMILRRSPDGTYLVYDIGNNAILAGYPLGTVGNDWAFVTLGGFNDGDTSDMLLRNSSTGGFQVYDISNNSIHGSAFLGNVGLNWQVMGFGNFSSLGENDMILRNATTGDMQVYDIRNNQITGSALLGTVGLNWQMAGVSNHGTQSDLVLRDSGTGGLEIYNINNNQITGAAFLGSIGLDWQASGFGDFSSRNEGDMLLRNVNTGGLMLYDIANNQITGSFFLGNIGLDWQYAGIASIHAPGVSDLVLRNVNDGTFEVYNISNNQIAGAAVLGTVGSEWQLGGFAADPPTGSMGSSDGSTSQLVQAMAGFGGGAADGLNTVPLGADTSQPPLLLTTPQHA